MTGATDSMEACTDGVPDARQHRHGRVHRGDGPNDVGLARVSLTRALEASLRRLGVETIDLYQAHAWDPLTPIEETLRFVDDAARAGKVHYLGSATSSAGSCRRPRC
jgi:aryl-alcohol dehydrogenase-like predicted oxidoreductase